MLTIQVTFVGGRVVGRRFSDRWNLDWMAQPYLGFTPLDTTEAIERRGVAGLRSALRAEGFALRVYKDGNLLDMTSRERAAFPATRKPRAVLRPEPIRIRA